MSASINKVLELCNASVGYTEGANNDTTFGKWFGLNNQPWCAMSASKMFFDAGARRGCECSCMLQGLVLETG